MPACMLILMRFLHYEKSHFFNKFLEEQIFQFDLKFDIRFVLELTIFLKLFFSEV